MKDKHTFPLKTLGIILVAASIIFWLIILVTSLGFFSASNANNDLIGKFGTMGDSFGIITSFVTLCTLVFLAYNIHIQEKEFEAIRSHTRKQEAINRAIKLIEEWRELDSEIKSKYKNINYLHENQKIFINRLLVLSQYDTKDHIDFGLIKSFLRNDISNKHLKDEELQLNQEIKELQQELSDPETIKRQEYLKNLIQEAKKMFSSESDAEDLISKELEDSISEKTKQIQLNHKIKEFLEI